MSTPRGWDGYGLSKLSCYMYNIAWTPLSKTDVHGDEK